QGACGRWHGSKKRIGRPSRTYLAFIAFVLTCTAFGSPMCAATYSWNVPSGDWSIDTNWSGAVPSNDDMAIVSNGGTASVTLPGATCNSLSLGDAAASTGFVQMTDGSLTINQLLLIALSGSGGFEQSGGYNSISSALVLGNESGAVGTYNLSGG